jgi:hypothetical protein
LVAVRDSLDFRRDTFYIRRIRNHDKNQLNVFCRFNGVRSNISAIGD